MPHRLYEIGLPSGFSTLLAVTIPETWLSYGGKLVFAVVVAVITSAVSALVSNAIRKVK